MAPNDDKVIYFENTKKDEELYWSYVAVEVINDINRIRWTLH